MFTSRSEYRVTLRADNADLRLTAKGRAMGVVSDERLSVLYDTKDQLDRGIALLEAASKPPQHWKIAGFDVRSDGNRRRCADFFVRRRAALTSLFRSAFDLLHYKNVGIDRLLEFVPGLEAFSPRILDRINVEGLYKQHVIRQTHDVELFLRDENLLIDEDLDYSLLPGMSNEVRQRLSLARPLTLVRLSFHLCVTVLICLFGRDMRSGWRVLRQQVSRRS